MTTTTSLIHHKPPPLKTRNDNPAVFLRANNYYGSVGRPSYGRRKSAVELLQESKAFYVKSESVLDNKQELKNAEHLHVRSPTMEMNHYRGGPPPSAPPAVGASFHYATITCGTCPPYPHEHLDHYQDIQLMHTNYLNSLKREKNHRDGSKVTAKITLVDGTKFSLENWDSTLPLPNKKSSANKAMRRSIQPPGTLPLMGNKETKANCSGKSNNGPNSGASLTFTSFSQNGSLYSSLEKHVIPAPIANLPVIQSVTKNSNQGKIRDRKEDPSEADSPPPLPPKSPRTSSKPNRPHDFPQRLVCPGSAPTAPLPPPPDSVSMLPPPPPRRDQHSRRSHHEPLINATASTQSQTSASDSSIIPPMTLPSPILPPTPPMDIVMESPMSDSGPIISPPPAFSTPVTPMLDRQNSSVSDRSAIIKAYGSAVAGAYNIVLQPQKIPLSNAVSMSGVSSISSRSHSHKSIPDDVSMRYSPRSRLSSTSPMSHQDIEPTTGNSGSGTTRENRKSGLQNNSISSEEEESEEAISADVDGDDDDSSRAAEEHQKLSRNNSRKSTVSDGGLPAPTSRRSPNRFVSTASSTTTTTQINLKSNVTITLSSNSNGKSSNVTKTQLSKSMTENFLSKVSHNSGQGGENGSLNHAMDHTHAAQTLPLCHPQRPRIVSPVRRPILRSKSDLSHRYLKASRSSTLTQGFTLVHVDLGPTGPPPPVPLHNSVSTCDFHTVSNNTSSSRPYSYDTFHYQKPHINHHSANHQSHYHQPLTQPILVVPSHSQIYRRPSNPSSSNYENILLNGKSDLDRFFDQLGLDNKSSLAPAPLPLNKLSKGDNGSNDSPVFFSSVSSVDSGARKSGSGDSEDSPVPVALTMGKIIGARTVGASGYSPNNNGNNGGTTTNNNNGGNSNGPSIVVHHGEPSIVERNARVIKWLFNCRKAMDNPTTSSTSVGGSNSLNNR